MDESRKQFEAEMAKLGDCVDVRRAKNGDEEYMAWDVRLAWRFWNLSRAAIEIELPEADLVYSSATDSYGVEGCMMLPESLVESVLQDAGIKVKE
ncbi:hypothetical protein EKS35_13895 [Enterobacter hormaechei subsp. steigerwaltii]|uniref:hypothetical protein n=1 Tax=Enterobacter cloacae complex TaxID=354276 RepID=UPI000F835C07|nr:hypothetical protein [Enterobacter hormaechei]RTY44025.1 hypothetical protein EKS35_13895 [Enterobacter hormaechei subsp. steigerwaltii]